MQRVFHKRRRLVGLFLAVCLTVVAANPATAQRRITSDDRPYDARLLRLSEILGAIHYLRELCGANEGQIWRKQMEELVRVEGSTAIRRANLVKGFNKGYRGYRRTYRACTDSAKTAVDRFMEEGEQISSLLIDQDR